jgi:hypothetical protein
VTRSVAERLLEELERPGRVRVDLEAVWQAYFEADPEFAHSPQKRERLYSCLQELAGASAIRLPATRRSFDRGQPPLPNFIRMNRAADAAPSPPEASRFPWCPELAWAAGARLSSEQFDELRSIHRFLVDGGRARPIVPSRERSLELFGDEKRLDALARTGLFGSGRLDWGLLRSKLEHPPLVWKALGPAPTMLVVENHHTYVSLGRTLPEDVAIGWLAYGAGRAFVTSVGSTLSLPMAKEDQALERILYFGDLDDAGLRIPAEASVRSLELGLPEVEPATALYALLFECGKPARAARQVPADDARTLAAWLGPALAVRAERLLIAGQRLAQEWVGYERLVAQPIEWWRSFAGKAG